MLRIPMWTLLAAAVLAATGCATPADPSNATASRPDATADNEARPTTVRISTSAWRPGDPGRRALVGGKLRFTRAGCPRLGSRTGVVWPAGYTSVVKPNGDQVIVTADGQQIAEGDTIEAGGAIAGGPAEAGMPCIQPGTELMLIESSVRVVSRP
jgi:hypothetical protein